MTASRQEYWARNANGDWDTEEVRDMRHDDPDEEELWAWLVLAAWVATC